MPYITSDRVKIIRKTIKDKYPAFKFSITRENYSGVHIDVMEGPIDFGVGGNETRGCMTVNQWSLKDTFKDNSPAISFWETIYAIANEGNGTLVQDGDYGNVPKFYVWLAIGKWDKPYVCTNPKSKIIAVQAPNGNNFVGTTTLKHETTAMISLSKSNDGMKTIPVTKNIYTTKLFSEFRNDLTTLK